MVTVKWNSQLLQDMASTPAFPEAAQ
ncbi:hypothetical protein LEMLEM_LOCUS22654 [Lemmus lemmus]